VQPSAAIGDMFMEVFSKTYSKTMYSMIEQHIMLMHKCTP